VKVPETKNKVVPKVAAPVPVATPLEQAVVAPISAPVAQNSTHQVVPVVEEETKEVTTKDTTTGEEKKEVVKVPVTKNKVVSKSADPTKPVGFDEKVKEIQSDFMDAIRNIGVAKAELNAAKAELKSAKPEEKKDKELQVAKAEEKEAEAEKVEAKVEVK